MAMESFAPDVYLQFTSYLSDRLCMTVLFLFISSLFIFIHKLHWFEYFINPNWITLLKKYKAHSGTFDVEHSHFARYLTDSEYKTAYVTHNKLYLSSPIRAAFPRPL